MSHNEVTPILMVISYLLGWAVGGPISVWARKEEIVNSGDDDYIEAYEKGFNDAAQDCNEALLGQHVSECEVCRIENGEQVYCNMADEIRKGRDE